MPICPKCTALLSPGRKWADTRSSCKDCLGLVILWCQSLGGPWMHARRAQEWSWLASAWLRCLMKDRRRLQIVSKQTGLSSARPNLSIWDIFKWRGWSRTGQPFLFHTIRRRRLNFLGHLSRADAGTSSCVTFYAVTTSGPMVKHINGRCIGNVIMGLMEQNNYGINRQQTIMCCEASCGEMCDIGKDRQSPGWNVWQPVAAAASGSSYFTGLSSTDRDARPARHLVSVTLRHMHTQCSSDNITSACIIHITHPLIQLIPWTCDCHNDPDHVYTLNP